MKKPVSFKNPNHTVQYVDELVKSEEIYTVHVDTSLQSLMEANQLPQFQNPNLTRIQTEAIPYDKMQLHKMAHNAQNSVKNKQADLDYQIDLEKRLNELKQNTNPQNE